MNNQESKIRSCSYNKDDDDYDDDGDDHHHHDMVMPGFRFHPTEQELIEFYLRRKVEGKRFNVELITLLDLYRYDPWELPALAAMGGKEWYFYVRRDRKYRNGDRPNRVTASGYWKATGADRSIKSDDFRAVIGLKKTLVFYSGKASKGVRTSWIMNEYRLLPPLHESEKQEKGEICLCRVYKRAGIIQENPTLRIPTKRASSSSNESPSTSTLILTRNHHRTDRASSISSSPLAVGTYDDDDDDLLKLVMNNSLLITPNSPSSLNNQGNPNRVHDDDVDMYPNTINVPYNLLLPSSSHISANSQMIAYIEDTMLWDWKIDAFSEAAANKIYTDLFE